jgi:malate synthase
MPKSLEGVSGVTVTVQTIAKGIEVRAPTASESPRVLTPSALEFLAQLHRRFDPTRQALLKARQDRQARIDRGEDPDFLPATQSVRDAAWQVAPPPKDLLDRRVEITGPTDPKMVINALNSGAKVFMADFEDANTPSWANLMLGQATLMEAVRRTLRFTSPEGKEYRLNERTATLLVRPRGWHLPERHVLVDGQPMSGSLFDFGLYVFHNAQELLARGTGPYFYLPKMESHKEARLWNEVFAFAEQRLGLPQASIRATCLIETILAAFEMDEFLYELRDRSVGLNAGRWDYLFSIIKKFRNRKDLVLPDRGQLTMTVPFMRAYTLLLVAACHRRGAHAMGGMAAFIPSRKDAQVNEKAMRKVREDKVREATDGFDGTWVAHPDLVAVAMEEFNKVLGSKPNQLDRQRPGVKVVAKDLLDFRVPDGRVTLDGVRGNVNVGLLYLESWLRGQGAAAIHNLMEDAATAEIARSQVWQWVHRGARLEDGTPVTRDLVRRILEEEATALQAASPHGRVREARELFESVALADDYPEFLTLPAYEKID